MIEHHPRFHASAGAEADQLRVVANRFRDFGAVLTQNLRLRAGDVIFGQFADLLEEIRAALVVKEFARQRARRARKSRDRLRRENPKSPARDRATRPRRERRFMPGRARAGCR